MSSCSFHSRENHLPDMGEDGVASFDILWLSECSSSPVLVRRSHIVITRKELVGTPSVGFLGSCYAECTYR